MHDDTGITLRLQRCRQNLVQKSKNQVVVNNTALMIVTYSQIYLFW